MLKFLDILFHLFYFDNRRRFDSEFLTDDPEPLVLRPGVPHAPGLRDLGLPQPLRVPGHEDGAAGLGWLEVTEGVEEALKPPGELRARATNTRVQGDEAVRQTSGGVRAAPLADVRAPGASWVTTWSGQLVLHESDLT